MARKLSERSLAVSVSDAAGGGWAVKGGRRRQRPVYKRSRGHLDAHRMRQLFWMKTMMLARIAMMKNHRPLLYDFALMTSFSDSLKLVMARPYKMPKAAAIPRSEQARTEASEQCPGKKGGRRRTHGRRSPRGPRR